MPQCNSPHDLKIWQLVLNAANELGMEIFTANDIVQKIHDANPDVNETSIRTYVIGMSPNHPTSHHYASTRRNHPCFEYLGNGKYRILKENNEQTTKELAVKIPNSLKNSREMFLEKYESNITTWVKENQNMLISGRKNYRWKNDSLAESIEKRNNLSRLIVLSRIKNNGGVDRDTLDAIMAWGFPNPLFPERDEVKCLEITREAYNLLDNGKPSEALVKLMLVRGVGISRASKVIGLFDQNYFVIYDSSVGNA
jgi:hypothetical protein